MGNKAIGHLLVASLMLSGLAATGAAGSPGTPKRSFGHKGIMRVDPNPSGNNDWDEVAIDSQGRIVVLARSRDDRSVLLRLRSDGSVDSAFGGDGRVPVGEGAWRALAVQSDSRIVVAGSVHDEMALKRFAVDGEPDPDFGTGGLVMSHLDSPLPRPQSGELLAEVRQVAIREDGRILALGTIRPCPPAEEICLRFAAVLSAYGTDGEIDDSFGNGGTVVLPWSKANGPPPQNIQMLDTLTLKSDGGILVGGDLEGMLAVLAFHADGSPDLSWGGGGIIQSAAETNEGSEGFGSVGSRVGEVREVLVHPGGRVVVVGRYNLLGLRPDGRVDKAFGEHGSLNTAGGGNDPEGVEVGDAALDSRGRILLAGEGNERSAIARITPNGRFDPRFAGDGLAALDLSKARFVGQVAEAATGIAVKPGGSVLSVGFAYAHAHSKLVLANLRNGDGFKARREPRGAGKPLR